MLSIVVVGRNDSHGYNLSKRVATSLNSLSLPMTGEDELIFVDWNSDDINPTFIDAIQDTLTEQTLKHLVVYRVRESIHKEFAQGIKRPILEPIARNVGIRRARNQWILSTNTDMIFDTHGKKYHEILSTLQPNLYHLFRYEIPEYVWDQFDRSRPLETLEKIRKIYTSQGLVAKILTKPIEGHENLFPDAVGDFQLSTQEIWQSVQGFPEDMLKGWHVDSRLSVQIEIKNKLKSQIISSDLIEGFHQDHLRVLTHFHGQTEMNTLDIIAQPYLNSSNWGLKDINLENSLSNLFSIDKLLEIQIQEKSVAPKKQVLQDLLNTPLYDLNLVQHFLLNDLINLPRGSRILVSTLDPNFVTNLRTYIDTLSLEMELITPENVKNWGFTDLAALVILDFGLSSETLKHFKQGDIVSKFELIINTNLEILENLPLHQRVVNIRAQHWSMRSLVHEYCSVPLFNNYPSLLSGSKIKNSRNFIQITLRKIKNFIRKKSYLDSNILSINFETSYIMRELASNGRFKLEVNLSNLKIQFIFKIYKKLPYRFRNFINPKIRKFLHIY